MLTLSTRESVPYPPAEEQDVAVSMVTHTVVENSCLASGQRWGR